MIPLHYIPWTVFLTLNVTFTITYIVAVSLKHTCPLYIYISDTGALPPESCIFTFGLMFAMMFSMLLGYIRYKQVEFFLKHEGHNFSSYARLRLLNKFSYGMALCAAVGMGILGSFQETNISAMHYLGATLAFVVAIIWMGVHGYFTWLMVPLFGTRLLALARMITAGVCFLFLLLGIVSAIISVEDFKHGRGKNLLINSVFSTVMEWITAILLNCYFLSFAPEFKNLTFVPPVFYLCRHTRKSLAIPRPSIWFVNPDDNGTMESDDEVNGEEPVVENSSRARV